MDIETSLVYDEEAVDSDAFVFSRTAILGHDTSFLSYLLEHSPSIRKLHSPDSSNETLLHVAARSHNSDATELLLGHGASCSRCDKHGETPLIYAISSGSLPVFRLLLPQTVKENGINISNESGRTALHFAAISSSSVNTEMVSQLVPVGALVNAVDSFRRTPLHLACMYSNVPQETIHFLVSCGLVMNKDSLGKTCLHLCAEMSVESACSELIVLEKNNEEFINDVCNSGKTALHYASQASSSSESNTVLEIILRVKYVRIDVTDISGRTPLHEAALSGNVHSVISLLRAAKNKQMDVGKYLEMTDRDGYTALHLCSQSNNENSHEIALVLLRSGANVCAQGKRDGSTPLHLSKRSEIVRVLRLAGGDVEEKNGSGMTPIAVARNEGVVEAMMSPAYKLDFVKEEDENEDENEEDDFQFGDDIKEDENEYEDFLFGDESGEDEYKGDDVSVIREEEMLSDEEELSGRRRIGKDLHVDVSERDSIHWKRHEEYEEYEEDGFDGGVVDVSDVGMEDGSMEVSIKDEDNIYVVGMRSDGDRTDSFGEENVEEERKRDESKEEEVREIEEEFRLEVKELLVQHSEDRKECIDVSHSKKRTSSLSFSVKGGSDVHIGLGIVFYGVRSSEFCFFVDMEWIGSSCCGKKIRRSRSEDVLVQVSGSGERIDILIPLHIPSAESKRRRWNAPVMYTNDGQTFVLIEFYVDIEKK